MWPSSFLSVWRGSFLLDVCLIVFLFVVCYCLVMILFNRKFKQGGGVGYVSFIV